MKIFVAGATGALGHPLVLQLLSGEHEVFGMSRTKERAEEIAKLGSKPIIADALDKPSIDRAIHQCKPDVVIEALTSLPKEYTPQSMKEAAAMNKKVRLEGGANLQSAAKSAKVRRYILQSSCFWYAPGSDLATEETPFALDSTLPVAEMAKVYALQEERVLQAKSLQSVILRFGFFYGPRTWYAKDGSIARQVQSKSYPIVGQGSGVWNFVHIEDAAKAVILALNGATGVYNITDDTPLPLAEWLPAYAKWLNAPLPSTRTIEKELKVNGPIAVYYATKLRGASNAKARKVLGFEPRPLEWLLK